jgi:anti-sigma factor RsiW
MKKHDGQGDCRELLMRMSRGVEGDLSPSERRALARHLAGCGRCGEFSESLKRTVRLCQEAGAPAMSARARTRARANIARLLSARSPHRDSRIRDAEGAKKPRRR